MKFYSENLNKLFDSQEACEQAEAEAKRIADEKAKAEAKKAETRKARAKEVEEALKAATAARAKYDKLLREFCKDYGAFHMSYTDMDKDFVDFFTSIF